MSRFDSRNEEHFRSFAVSLERAIAVCRGTDTTEFLELQKNQVNKLIGLERQFRKTLIGHPSGDRIYRDFISYICETRRNILDARPYFRERQFVFTKHISKALRNKSVKVIQRFRFNYRFVQFVLAAFKWKPGSEIVKISKEIDAIRNDLITMNMPLAISRARIFYSRTPKSHLSYMDFIQIGCEGLMSGIDKFVPPFSKAFRAVAIGRITGNYIENYSETAIHFYPVDKRKIYRANKILGKNPGDIDYDKLVLGINDGIEKAHQTDQAEIENLMAAASTVSADTPTDEDDTVVRVVDRFSAPVDTQPDVLVESTEAMAKMKASMSMLTCLELKVAQLKGIHVDASSVSE